MESSLRASVVLALLLSGCESCGGGGPVPFGLDAGTPGQTAAEVRPVREATAGAATARRVHRALPPGTTRAEVEGAAVEVPGASLRALSVWDHDGDGDRDVLLLTDASETASPKLLAFVREGVAFGAPRELASATSVGAGCVVDDAEFEDVGESLVRAAVGATCAEDGIGSRRLHTFAIDGTARPRLLERFGLRGRVAEDGAKDAIALRAEDRDGDGHPDLVATVSLLAPGEGPVSVELAFLDRPGGLARAPGEPEATAATLAQEARGLVRRQHARARTRAERALTLWEALCRESGRARVEVGGTLGVPCGRSSAAGRALSVLAQAAAKGGEPLVAAEAIARLADPNVSVRDAERTAALGALAALPSSAETVLEGPVAQPQAGRAPRLSALAFLSEDELLLRGDAPRVVSLASGEEVAADVRPGLDLVDPAGTLRLLDIERRCEGTVLVLGPSGEFAALAGTRSVARIASRPAPSGAPCPDLTPTLRADADGWSALGWAPQGVLVRRGSEIRIVPLDLSGAPAGEPATLSEGAPIPTPIAPGSATADARFAAQAVPGGIAVVELQPARRVTFVRPSAFPDAEGAPFDVAISPSGRRLAWIAQGRVRWIERATGSR